MSSETRLTMKIQKLQEELRKTKKCKHELAACVGFESGVVDMMCPTCGLFFSKDAYEV